MNVGLRSKKIAGLRAAVAFASALLVAAGVLAQAPASPPPPDQSKQTDQQKPATQAPSQANPFPEDTNNVPLLPSSSAPAAPEPGNGAGAGPAPALPGADVDPVRSPDEPLPDTASSNSSGSSSSSADLANILAPPPDEETRNTRKGKNQPAPEHQETAKEDENVGSYYLEQKNWKAALSRYQSALVLDPENPDVYWGLAESQRHLGDVANAKANYKKVMEYDPDSRHAKDAKKLLSDPDMAKAPAAPAPHP